MKEKIDLNDILKSEIELPLSLKKMSLVDSIKFVRSTNGKPSANLKKYKMEIFRGEPFFKPISKI